MKPHYLLSRCQIGPVFLSAIRNLPKGFTYSTLVASRLVCAAT